jgi:hypothetical protein
MLNTEKYNKNNIITNIRKNIKYRKIQKITSEKMLNTEKHKKK